VAGPLLVVDAPHVLYRAFFALPDKVRHRALVGSVNQVLRVVEERDPRAVVMAFGPDSAEYRTEAFPAYHAHRPPVPDDLATDWALARDLYTALGWIVADTETLEADDVMHAYALAEGGPVLILTGDRDMFQCVTDDVHVLLQGRGETTEMGRAEVVERYGVLPEQVPDFIALRGDPSDGIPGAKGIGEKGAAELLQRHGTLEAAIAGAVRESKPTVRRALIEQADELRMFRDLATLRDPGAPRPPDTPTDRVRGAEAAEALGLANLAKRIAGRATFDGPVG
jgi:DNA polymerase-1